MRHEIKRIMASIFRIEASEIGDDAKINKVRNWDSLGHITLMLALEDHFKVRISSDNIMKLQSLEAIERFLAQPGQPVA